MEYILSSVRPYSGLVSGGQFLCTFFDYTASCTSNEEYSVWFPVISSSAVADMAISESQIWLVDQNGELTFASYTVGPINPNSV